MFDTNTYDYVPLYMPNVLAEVDKGATDIPVVASRTFPLLDALVKKYPRWKFVGRQTYASTKTLIHFRVYDGSQQLGSISSETAWKYGDRYLLKSPRLDKQRERGHETRTKDLKKAIKLVSDNYYAKTLTELVGVSREVINIALSSAVSKPHGEHRLAYSRVESFAKQYVANHWEAFLVEAKASGTDLSYVGDYPAIRSLSMEADRVGTAVRERKGVDVVIHGATYVVRDSSQDEPVLYTSDTLPSDVKTKLALLKLMDNNEYIDGVGIKASDSTYFIMDDPE
jgi:hypothetical protein